MSLLVELNRVGKVYRGRGFRPTETVAVDDISFQISAGQSLALVGESGSGKSTIARMICGLERPTRGELVVNGHRLQPGADAPKSLFRDVKMIFQDPYLSMSPRMTVESVVGYELRLKGVRSSVRRARVAESLQRVGLPRALLTRYPHELSTGQRQRVGIARAIIGDPVLVVADEPLSSVDVSLQAQILNLLVDIQDQTGITYLYISHDLAPVSYLCDRIIVMKHGRMVEAGSTFDVLESPTESYTRLLVEAAFLDLVKDGSD